MIEIRGRREIRPQGQANMHGFMQKRFSQRSDVRRRRVDWYELLSKADEMESLINRHWEERGQADRDHRVKLVVDEWGTWHHKGTEADITHLCGQTSTMRDALIAGLTLDTFNRNPPR